MKLSPEAVANAPEWTCEPEPLRRTLPPPEPYPVDVLGALLAPMARKLMQVIQAPDALCAQSILSAAALAVQGHANLDIDGRLHPLAVFAVTIGETGERKTTVDRYALWPHRHWERMLHEQYDRDCVAYHNDLEAYRKAREEALRRAKGRQEKRLALETLGEPPLAPLLPILVTEEPTYEGLVKLLLIGQPSIGLFTDEGGRLIGGHGMNADNQLKTAAGLSELWDGKRITRVRGGDGTAVLYGRRVSMHLMAQPAVAQLMLGNRLLLEQGLLSRCLVVWPTTTAGTREYRGIDLSIDPDVSRYNAQLFQIMKAPLPLAEGARNELNPRELSLEPQAKRLWMAFYNHVEHQLGEGGPLAPVRGFANKAAEHAARLAGVLTLVADLGAGTIDAQCMAAGIELAQFYLTEALRLFHTAAIDPDLVLAEKLLSWAQQYEEIHLPQIYQYGPNSIRDAKTARRLVAILEDHGWLLRIEDGLEIDGTYRREVWRVYK